jgi:hypothetical protein
MNHVIIYNTLLVGTWFKIQYQIKLFYHQIMLARAGTKTTAKKQASLMTSTAAEMQETVLTPNTLCIF